MQTPDFASKRVNKGCARGAGRLRIGQRCIGGQIGWGQIGDEIGWGHIGDGIGWGTLGIRLDRTRSGSSSPDHANRILFPPTSPGASGNGGLGRGLANSDGCEGVETYKLRGTRHFKDADSRCIWLRHTVGESYSTPSDTMDSSVKKLSAYGNFAQSATACTARGIYPSDPLHPSTLGSQYGRGSSPVISSSVAAGENSWKHQPVTWADADGLIQDLPANSIHSGAPYMTVNDYETWSRHCQDGKLYGKSLGWDEFSDQKL
ncbi:hypothetical protein BS47DRAFT_1366480 [Hydnum rufescens UP504]|uniref:Uncharacterized protein n=1 Tax=Hydnum rufescens UP504 TaxID=1448309 RepID=A0A9P6ALY4_9AGAM|nr:hypothetical protein BS47DRAFT_1366480 [Hydnum rufescens UP504]